MEIKGKAIVLTNGVYNTINGFNSKDSNPFYLKRISAGIGSSMHETIVKSSGLWVRLKNIIS